MQLVGDETMNSKLKTHTVRVQELANFIGCKDKEIYDALDEIMSTVVHIGDRKNPKQQWTLIHWVSLAKHDGWKWNANNSFIR